MKTYAFIVLFFLLIINKSSAQQGYSESVYDYQVNYKKDLSDIIQSDTSLIRFYPVDPTYKVVATVQRLPNEKFFQMPSSDGQFKQAIKYGLVKFTLQGKEYQVYAYQLSNLVSSPEYKDHFFIPFTDASSGLTSYGGGRYIDFVTADINAEGKLVIDFNKAYNPYCAFRSEYSCPIPPKENDIPIEIKAGEMNFAKSK